MLASSREYSSKGISPGIVADDMEEYFQNQGYETQGTDKEGTHVVQAKKAGVLRDLVAGDRAFTVIIAPGPDKLKVSIGVGK